MFVVRSACLGSSLVSGALVLILICGWLIECECQLAMSVSSTQTMHHADKLYTYLESCLADVLPGGHHFDVFDLASWQRP